MRYLLDTHICINLIKSHPPQVLRRLEALNRGSAVMSVVTHNEADFKDYPGLVVENWALSA